MADIISQLNGVITDISGSESTKGIFLYNELEKLKTNLEYDMIYRDKIHAVIGDISNNLLGNVERNVNHKKRQQDIQDYYNKNYQQQIFILKLVIFFSVIALVGCLFFNFGLISVYLLSFYLGVVLSVAFVVVFYYLWDFFVRDNQVFDEYEFSIYLPPKMDGTDLTKQKDIGGLSHNLKDNIIYC